MNIDDFIKELKKELVVLIADQYQKESDAIKNDVDLFITNSKDKLKRWTELLASKLLTKEEYKLLISSQKDLFTITALHKAGVSAISLGHFKNKVINLIIKKGISLIP